MAQSTLAYGPVTNKPYAHTRQVQDPPADANAMSACKNSTDVTLDWLSCVVDARLARFLLPPSALIQCAS